MDTSRRVLIQMGVRPQLERQVCNVNLKEGQRLVWRGTSPLTQQEGHRYSMAHFQDGCFLAVEANGGHEIDAQV